MSVHSDPFFEQYFAGSPQPEPVPFALRKGDRLVLIGDSITESNRYSRMLETYLAACKPELEVEVRNVGKGGETAEGFLKRIESECLKYRPTAATICYGMNDAGYLDNNLAGADTFRAASARIVSTLKAAGIRMVLASPGCIGRLPTWQFVKDLNGTLNGINTSLFYIRNQAADIATAEQLPFVDHFWNLYRARFTAAEKYGAEYAICGADDGVHPSWAGHTVMAFGLFSALGFDGDLGHFNIDLATKTAAVTGDHVFKAEAENAYTFVSRRYPFCAEGMLDKDWFIRSGMTLLPFNQQFNRMTLKLTGVTAFRYRVAWTDAQNMLNEWHTYSRAELEAGINLADDFQRTPFSNVFHRIDDLVFQKQAVESAITWRETNAQWTETSLEECEAQRIQLLDQIKREFVPITHNIRIEAV
ncbi:lipolytic enzyme, partial [bacterium]|nr:lipolytic enzyme [bacterium]